MTGCVWQSSSCSNTLSAFALSKSKSNTDTCCSQTKMRLRFPEVTLNAWKLLLDFVSSSLSKSRLEDKAQGSCHHRYGWISTDCIHTIHNQRLTSLWLCKTNNQLYNTNQCNSQFLKVLLTEHTNGLESNSVACELRKCAVGRLTPCAADKGKHSVMRPAGSSSSQCPQVEGADWFWLSCHEESLLSANVFIML